MLCGVQSAAVLEVFMVRSKEERDKVVKRKRRKAQKRSVKEGATPAEVREKGTNSHVMVCLHLVFSNRRVRY